MNLPLLKPGQSGVIRSINGNGMSPKFFEMGFLPGRPVRVVNKIFKKGPLYVEIQGCFIALRHEEAEAIFLQDKV